MGRHQPSRPWNPSSFRRRTPLMFDLAALGIAAACFAFAFAVLYVLGRV
jgi:hypothetical protein